MVAMDASPTLLSFLSPTCTNLVPERPLGVAARSLNPCLESRDPKAQLWMALPRQLWVSIWHVRQQDALIQVSTQLPSWLEMAPPTPTPKLKLTRSLPALTASVWA